MSVRLPAGVVAFVGVVGAFASLHAQAADDPARTDKASRSRAGLVSASTLHLDLVGEASAETVSAGERLTLRFSVTPKPGFYVYAPGADYRVIQVRVEASPLLRVHEAKYPESAMHFFEPFKEWVPVYRSAFELVQQVTIGATPRARAQLARSGSVTIRGVVEYQACDARVCYLPATIPFEWPVRVRTAAKP